MIRVLHVIPSVAPRYGGPSTAVVALCDALNSLKGVSAEIAATDADGPTRFHPSGWQSNTPLHLFPIDGSERFKRSRALDRWLLDNAPRFDVIHSHSSWNAPVHSAARAARRHRIPLVYRPCGMLSDYTWTRGRLAKWAYWLARERANVQTAAVIHCTSEGEATEVRRYRTVRGRVEVIPNGVEASAWTVPEDPDTLRRRCGPAAHKRPIVLYLSRLHPKKGLTDVLLPALQAMTKDAFLAIVGGEDDHSPGYEKVVRSEVERLGLTGRVALLGPVAGAERWAMFDGADVFALPSHSENFGIVVAEAMARGCPVLVTDGVQAHEHVTRASAGEVVRPDVKEVAIGLDRLLGTAAHETGLRGRAYAQEHFQWDGIAKRIAKVYRSLTRQDE
jgi:glycosyltransferase involved in cell wall biosynthesis